MSQIDLQELHAAGAEIAGHADAWLALGRQPRVKNDRLNLVEKVRTLHISLARRVVPADICPPLLTAAPPPPPAPAPEPTPTPEPTMPTTDPLLAELDATIAARPRGATKALAATLGIDSGSLNYWRQSGKIPEARRDAVRAWIDTPQIIAIRVEKTKPEPKPAKAPKVIKAPIKPTRPITPAHHMQTVCDLCRALDIHP